MSKTPNELHEPVPLGIPQGVASAENPQGMADMLNALKLAVETITRQTGDIGSSAITVNDLVELGVVDAEDIEAIDQGGSR